MILVNRWRKVIQWAGYPIRYFKQPLPLHIIEEKISKAKAKRLRKQERNLRNRK